MSKDMRLIVKANSRFNSAHSHSLGKMRGAHGYSNFRVWHDSEVASGIALVRFRAFIDYVGVSSISRL